MVIVIICKECGYILANLKYREEISGVDKMKCSVCKSYSMVALVRHDILLPKHLRGGWV